MVQMSSSMDRCLREVNVISGRLLAGSPQKKTLLSAAKHNELKGQGGKNAGVQLNVKTILFFRYITLEPNITSTVFYFNILII